MYSPAGRTCLVTGGTKGRHCGMMMGTSDATDASEAACPCNLAQSDVGGSSVASCPVWQPITHHVPALCE